MDCWNADAWARSEAAKEPAIGTEPFLEGNSDCPSRPEGLAATAGSVGAGESSATGRTCPAEAALGAPGAPAIFDGPSGPAATDCWACCGGRSVAKSAANVGSLASTAAVREPASRSDARSTKVCAACAAATSVYQACQAQEASTGPAPHARSPASHGSRGSPLPSGKILPGGQELPPCAPKPARDAQFCPHSPGAFEKSRGKSYRLFWHGGCD